MLVDTKKIALIKIWSHMMQGARDYVRSQGFTEIVGLPAVTTVSGSCEAVANIFSLDYFDKTAYLAQSNQLHLEMITPHLSKVYAEVLSFRREPEANARHLTQFNLFELEFLGGFEELLQYISGTVRSAANSVANNCQAELALFNQDPGVIRDLSFSRVSYTDAVNLLVKHFPELKWGDDLKSDHEKTLAAIYGPVFVHRYEEKLKFFNMKPDPEDPKVVLSADLLLPGVGESAGAAERATDLATIKDRLFKSSMYAHMKAMGIKDEEFDWYLNYHRDNTVAQHSGTGIGMARVAQFILGLDDIRDAVPFLINSENLI